MSWHKDYGYSHYIVDDGEPMAGVSDTPLLYANGPFERDRDLKMFLNMSPEMPANIVSDVEARLREFNGSPAP